MSAAWLKLITILCLSCTALSGPDSEVLWKDVGGSFTIQCRAPEPEQDSLTLKKGLSKDIDVFHKPSGSDKNTTAEQFKYRLQFNGKFPNVDILIKNLTSNDTGPYWCCYAKFDLNTATVIHKKGTGSVLLVVSGTETKQKQCDPSSDKNLVLVSVVISAAVLLGIVIGFFIWITLKTKTLRNTVKPRHVTTNDVYEDMRGTLRR
ncbi:uncharacterized protein LOC127356954 isoform X2 [Dicentrarchus labrax]|uniref:uncharacterized protein LOC127356954 isoform X2 n=1 Tax=Dicentrarchus labrax TaxID=13489 RepID=UPI0021F5582B|nr:uncharacterized protein LOC127356954 isoform X2 [Dicentrarchus labrax]